MTLRTSFAVVAFALTTLPASAHMIIEAAYARAATPNAKTGAAFMQITNHSESADRLVGVLSNAAKRVELHTHEETSDGVMMMIHVDEGFAFEPNETISLARGGKHVMLMGLNAPLVQDETVSITLIFENAGEVPVIVPVDNLRKAEHGSTDHSGHKMDHSTHTN